MKKISLWLAAIGMTFIVGGTITSLGVTAQPAAAAGGCTKNGSFLGFPPWYRGLQNSDCSIKSPGNNLSGFIWTIALNIIDDALRLVGFASVAFIIYGGFKYMTSQGSSDGMSKAKTTILNAIIGLVLSIMSIAIVNLAVGAFQ